MFWSNYSRLCSDSSNQVCIQFASVSAAWSYLLTSLWISAQDYSVHAVVSLVTVKAISGQRLRESQQKLKVHSRRLHYGGKIRLHNFFLVPTMLTNWTANEKKVPALVRRQIKDRPCQSSFDAIENLNKSTTLGCKTAMKYQLEKK